MCKCVIIEVLNSLSVKIKEPQTTMSKQFEHVFHLKRVWEAKRKIIELCPRDPFDLENRLQFQFARVLNELTDIPKEPR